MNEPQPPPAEGWVAGLLNAAKSLTFTNVLIIALLVIVAIPAYAAYTMLNDPTVMDRFLSSYSETTDKDSECTVRKARARGGPWLWSISAGFAAQRSDRYALSVVLSAEPDANDIASYCATINLIISQMLFGYHGDPAP
jgi:hypothetical protein